jgi:hypothetical protein
MGSTSPDITRISGGSFSYSPVRTILGSTLDGAAQATAPNASSQTHRKLDNTGYRYQGRSFGVGASVGFAEVPTQNELRCYTFEEPGYMASITCWYDRKMSFHISQVPEGDQGYPLFYRANGTISSGSYEDITLPGFNDREVVALLGNPHKGRNVWGIATGQKADKYSQINQTSCEAFFDKRLFGVVDGANRLTTVTPHAENLGPSNTIVDLRL